MPNASPRPWRMFLPLGIVLVLAAVWTIYWFVASGIAKDRFQDMRERFAAKGLTLVCAKESWGGFPFHFELTCTSPVIMLAGKAEARSENLLLVALAYAPRQVVALLDGPTTISTSTLKPMTAKHERAVAAITFDGGAEPKVSAEFPAIVIDGFGTAGMLRLHSRPAAVNGTDIAVSVSKLNYQPPGKPPLAVEEANLLGTAPDDDSLKIDQIEVLQGQLRCSGSGSVSLDEQRRLAGKIDAETNDIDALLALLAPQLRLSETQTNNLRTMLGLLGSETKASVIAKDGALYLGPFKITDLPPVY